MTTIHRVVNSVVIEIADLRVQRGGDDVIPGLSATISAGEITGLLGPSGCGKTTLLRSIIGVQEVAGGAVTVLGHPAGSAELRRRVAYMTQTPSVYGDLSVRENLRFFAAVLRADPEAVDEALKTVDLSEAANSRVDRLSGGQRSRVSLAVALLADPDVLVLDEPTVGLDPVLRRQLWGMFSDLAQRGRAILVSSHVMDEAQRCDRLLLMRAGDLIADETPVDLLARTRTGDVESAFLSLVGSAAHR
jgi:ABC-2 type transport system ATP-binding protein